MLVGNAKKINFVIISVILFTVHYTINKNYTSIKVQINQNKHKKKKYLVLSISLYPMSSTSRLSIFV